MGVDAAVIQLVTRCESEDEFVERFARFTTETGIVVPALPHVSAGTTGRFVIRLKDQFTVMAGRCEVSEMLPMPAAPGAPAQSARILMRLRLIEMDAHSRGVHLRLLERRAERARPTAAQTPAPEPPRPPQPTMIRALSIVRTPPPEVVPPPVPEPLPVARRHAATLMGTAASLGLAAPPVPAPPVPVPTIAPAAPVAAAATAAAATAAPAAAAATPLETEPTEVSPVPRPETRVPGAALTLPANPLSEFDGADLSSFVDLMLIEKQAPSASHHLDRALRIGRRAWPYASCVLVGLLLGPVVRPGSTAAPVAAPPPAAAPAAVAVAAPAPIAAGARRDCTAKVRTTPAGATVLWGDVSLGPSPIDGAPIPCGRASITVRRERYLDVTRTITAEPGQGAVISERLQRPPAKLIVKSSPPNAIIKLNKRSVGSAPRKLASMRYEHVRIDASLPGYRPWSQTLYLRQAETNVDIALTPVAKPAARRSAAR